MFGLLNLWHKKENKAEISPVQPQREQSNCAVISDSKPIQQKPIQSESIQPVPITEPAIQIDPLQAAVDKISTRPAGEYILFENAAESFPQRILELGMDDCQRISCLLQFGVLVVPPAELFYIGLDWFEGRTETQRPGLPFTQAYKLFIDLGVKCKLQPGEPTVSFLPVANALTSKKIDWVMISGEISSKKMRTLWSLFPRILKPTTKFFLEKDGQYRLIPVSEVEKIARKAAEIARKRL